MFYTELFKISYSQWLTIRVTVGYNFEKHKSEYVSNFDIMSEKKKSFGENQKKLSVNLFIFIFLSKGTKKTNL